MKEVVVTGDPRSEGYKRFKISKSDQKSIFPNKEYSLFSRYEYYVKRDRIILHEVPNLLCCVTATAIYPLTVFYFGFKGYKILFKDMVVDSWYSKKYGKFPISNIYLRQGDKVFNSLLESAVYY